MSRRRERRRVGPTNHRYAGVKDTALKHAFRLSLLLSLLPLNQAEAAPLSFSAELGTDFPVSVGARALLEHPASRVRLNTGVGWMPGSYVDGINAFVIAVDGYKQETADLIEASLKDSMVWHVSLGWKPAPRAGFYTDIGYRFVGFGGGLAASTVISKAIGVPLPSEEGSGDFNAYDVSTSVHMAMAEVGWLWAVGERWTLRAGLGATTAFGAEAVVDLDEDQEGFWDQSAAAGLSFFDWLFDFQGSAEDHLEETLHKHMHAPVVSVALGYRFF